MVWLGVVKKKTLCYPPPSSILLGAVEEGFVVPPALM
jgi:hypothetical protein